MIDHQRLKKEQFEFLKNYSIESGTADDLFSGLHGPLFKEYPSNEWFHDESTATYHQVNFEKYPLGKNRQNVYDVEFMMKQADQTKNYDSVLIMYMFSRIPNRDWGNMVADAAMKICKKTKNTESKILFGLIANSHTQRLKVAEKSKLLFDNTIKDLDPSYKDDPKSFLFVGAAVLGHMEQRQQQRYHNYLVNRTSKSGETLRVASYLNEDNLLIDLPKQLDLKSKSNHELMSEFMINYLGNTNPLNMPPASNGVEEKYSQNKSLLGGIWNHMFKRKNDCAPD